MDARMSMNQAAGGKNTGRGLDGLGPRSRDSAGCLFVGAPSACSSSTEYYSWLFGVMTDKLKQHIRTNEPSTSH
jgi:hypothetical protein